MRVKTICILLCLMVLMFSCTRSLVIQDSEQMRDHLNHEDTGEIHTNDGRNYDLGGLNTYTFENDTIFLAVRLPYNPIPKRAALPLSDVNRLENNSVNWPATLLGGALVYLFIDGLNSKPLSTKMNLFR